MCPHTLIPLPNGWAGNKRRGARQALIFPIDFLVVLGGLALDRPLLLLTRVGAGIPLETFSASRAARSITGRAVGVKLSARDT